jgi:translocator protein
MNYKKLILSILIPVAVGAISGFFTNSGVEGWYAVANKPSFNPPNWIFAPVWTTLYILMGIAMYLIWNAAIDEKKKRRALLLYALQLMLNFLWSFIFFEMQQPGAALIEIILMWFSILLTLLAFGKINKAAAGLLVPYLCWVSFAIVLNYEIWSLN